jgi:hypothetical protein
MHARSWTHALVISVLTLIAVSDDAKASVLAAQGGLDLTASTHVQAPSRLAFHAVASADGSLAFLRFGEGARSGAYAVAFSQGLDAPGSCAVGETIGLGGAPAGYVTELVPGATYAFRVCDVRPDAPAFGLGVLTMPRGEASVVAARSAGVTLAPPSAAGALVPDAWVVVARPGVVPPVDCTDGGAAGPAALFAGGEKTLSVGGLAPRTTYAFRVCGVFSEPVRTPQGDYVTSVTSAGATVVAKTAAP